MTDPPDDHEEPPPTGPLPPPDYLTAPGYPPLPYPFPVLRRPGHAGRNLLIASGVLTLIGFAIFIGAVLLSDNATKQSDDPSAGEAYGFLAVTGLLPCAAAVVLFIVGLVLVVTESKQRRGTVWYGPQQR